ncbi:hypothetical protein [Planctomicrobium piriforme]|uniref:Uncharacterized protein n=1 Tax=Planctomicrobium piriforme TaxID=1576369 RepID=A0A1I3FAU9_9PLAN|nr:hypothetical protein [Planctomicrobium piriforme]SFI07991.1 hypothetical protein SAMN05421753_105144 [Planctomicrobium piriforme]
MSRLEADRDDLYEELRLAPFRWELRVPDQTVPVFAAIRENGRFSLYLTPDEVYHFDEKDRLQRAFLNGELYRTQGATLARLRRHREPHETSLLRHDLDSAELPRFLQHLQSQLHQLQVAFTNGSVTILRSNDLSPEAANVLSSRLSRCLAGPLQLAPAYPTRRS